jgi:hypothetical protein
MWRFVLLFSLAACKGGDDTEVLDDTDVEDSDAPDTDVEDTDVGDTDCDEVPWFEDGDADGFGDPGSRVDACERPGEGWIARGGDCDDTNGAVHPDAAEVCDDGLDNDCDGAQETGCDGCDWHVPGDFPRIAGALSSAVAGDVICVAAGTYTENLTFRAADVELVGEGADLTVIDGGAKGPVITIDQGNGPATVVRGFTIRNGAAKSGAYAGGGGVHVVDSSPTLRELVLSGNADAGIGLTRSSSLVEDCEVTDNTYATRGGGMNVYGAGAPVVRRTRFTGNTGLYGGALHVESTDLVVEDVWIEGNTANYGGAIEVSSATLTVSGAAFLENTGGYSGFYATLSTVALDHVVFLGNVHTSGGAAYLSQSDATIAWAVFAGTQTTGSGGAMSIDRSDVVLSHAVITKNKAQWGGAAAVWDGSLTLDHVIVTANDTYGTTYDDDLECFSGPCTLTVSDTVGWDVFVDYEFGSVSGWSSVDPALSWTSGTDPYAWDLHLSASSAAIDLGSASDPDGSPSDPGPFGGAEADGWDLDGDGYALWWQPGPWDASSGADCDDLDPSAFPGSGC